MTTLLPKEQLNDYEVAAKLLPDGRRVVITQMTFGKFRINVCEKNTTLFYSDQY